MYTEEKSPMHSGVNLHLTTSIRVSTNGTSVTPRYGVVAKICPKYGHMGIWAYGHMGIWAYVKKYGQVGYPRKENQKCSSEMLTRGP